MSDLLSDGDGVANRKRAAFHKLKHGGIDRFVGGGARQDNLVQFAARFDGKIQASAGAATQAQIDQPLGELHTVWRTAWMHEYMGFKAPVAAANVLPFPTPGADLEIPEFLRRAA